MLAILRGAKLGAICSNTVEGWKYVRRSAVSRVSARRKISNSGNNDAGSLFVTA
jgi:hypothetical protein